MMLTGLLLLRGAERERFFFPVAGAAACHSLSWESRSPRFTSRILSLRSPDPSNPFMVLQLLLGSACPSLLPLLPLCALLPPGGQCKHAQQQQQHTHTHARRCQTHDANDNDIRPPFAFLQAHPPLPSGNFYSSPSTDRWGGKSPRGVGPSHIQRGRLTVRNDCNIKRTTAMGTATHHACMCGCATLGPEGRASTSNGLYATPRAPRPST